MTAPGLARPPADSGRTLRRAIRRGLEAVHVIGWCAVGGTSRRHILGAYRALQLRTWDPAPFDTRLRFGRRIMSVRCRQRDIYVIGEILHDRLYRLESVLPAGPVIVDAGANIGVSALWFASLYPGVRLYCFEPEAANFALLQHNLRQVDNATCEHAALGAVSGDVTLHVTGNASDHSVHGSGESGRTERVPCLRLGEYLERNGILHVDLLKLDVEGSEADVLEGLGDGAGRVAAIVGEVHERHVDQSVFYEMLRRLGFRRVIQRRGYRDGTHAAHMFEAIR